MSTFTLLAALSTFSIFAETTKIMSNSSMDNALSVDHWNGRIMNGYPNQPGEIPYIVSLGTNFSFFNNCAGSIIDHEWILTSARCLKDVIVIPISYGTINWEKPLIRHFVNRENFFIHENYLQIEDGAINDIALINTPYVEFSDLINKIKLPDIMDDYDGYWARASGWGQSNYRTKRLFSIDMPILSNFQCSQHFSLLDTQICTGLRSSKSICNGDYGGPLVLNPNDDLNEPPFLIGITSFGHPLCFPGYPNVFTRVTEYLTWIEDIMKTFDKK